MYPPKSWTDPEMFYRRSTDREMAARRRRRTCVQAHVCVVTDTGRALYEAPGVRPLQTPHSEASTRLVLLSAEPRVEGDKPLQLHGPRRTCQPFHVLLSLLKTCSLNEGH